MAQDDDGFMWFATRYGLYRYDGYSFKVFVHEPENPNSLDGVVVNALFKDRDGALWAGCDQSLNKFDRTTETFRRYPIPFANHIMQDRAGMLWVTCRGGLYSVDPASGRTRHYSSNPNDPSSLSNNDLTYCGEDKQGKFWVASNGHLDEFDRKAGKVARHILLPEATHGFDFFEDRFGMFWLFQSSPSPLAVLDRETNTLTHYTFPEQEPTVMRVSQVLEDRNGTLWIATHGLGLLKLDREQGRFIHYGNLPLDAESLPQNKLDALFLDRVGNIWAAPGRLAPAFLPTRPPPFRRLPKPPGSTIEPFVGALYEDHQGIVWIGTPEALDSLDRKTGRMTAYRAGGPAVGTDVISIFEDRSNNLWVGTWGHGLHRFDRRTGKFTTYQHDPADPYSLSNDIVMREFLDHRGTLWVATGDGVNRFDPVTGRFKTYRIDPQRSVLCLALAEDREGKIWIGTESSGLRRFDPENGQFISYEHNRSLPGTLSDDRVNAVHFDRSGTMWVGTQNGLDKFDPHTGTFAAFTERDGLPGNAVGCVLEDNHGNLWMSTNNGVARFNSGRRAFSSFSTADGLPGPNLTGWGACFQSPSGEMFFGGFNGGASFFPDQVVDSSYAPPIVLTDFRLSGNPVEIGGHSPLQRSISYTSDLILPYQQNVFSITFAALSYTSPSTNRYRYRLDGLDRDWNEVGSDRRQATYTTLPPGTYTFHAQGATTSGPWREPGVALRIRILPPWWNARPFQAAAGAVLFLIAWAAYRQRVHRISRQFEARLAERTRIARELHDTLLQSFQAALFEFQTARNLFSKHREDAFATLDNAMGTAQKAIVEGRDAIQDLRREVPQSDLEHLLTTAGQEIASSQVSDGDRPAFRVTVEGPQRELVVVLQDEIFQIGREVLRNAFRHASASRIEVEIRFTDRLFRMRIRDDGKGIDRKVLQEGTVKGHWGLPGMRERAKRIGGRLVIWSEAGAGTEVELSVPARVAYAKSHARRRFQLFRKSGEE